jgi:hypothetical protein
VDETKYRTRKIDLFIILSRKKKQANAEGTIHNVSQTNCIMTITENMRKSRKDESEHKILLDKVGYYLSEDDDQGRRAKCFISNNHGLVQ